MSSSPLPALVVFGSQASALSTADMDRLRKTLLQDTRLRPVSEAICAASDVWRLLIASDARLESTRGAEHLAALAAWLESGRLDVPASANVVQCPLTVLANAIDYLRLLTPGGASHGQVLEATREGGGVQGFCTGLLCAIAVSCATDEASLVKLFAVAIRLAICVGAYVDLDNPGLDRWHALAIRWCHDQGLERLREILSRFPDAYVSVVIHRNMATVTCPAETAGDVEGALAQAGMTARKIPLYGRFHTQAHKGAVERLAELCAGTPDLCFPPAHQLQARTRSNYDGEVLSGDEPLQMTALRSILLEPCDWHLATCNALSGMSNDQNTHVLHCGMTDSIPASVMTEKGLKNMTAGNSAGPDPDRAVAVIGMACRFPGASSPEEFWELIQNVESKCRKMPEERFSTNGLQRDQSDKTHFWGCFIDDVDAFDHRLFKKSSREAASMDPQQRLALEVAYAALESAGWLSQPAAAESDVGCYLGVCSSDYNDNVASHPPNAYSSLGTLRAFLSGNISHFFGLTGPSITYDTACSSSAVAIDAACRAILSGECSAALAGGVSIHTSPYFYENLSAASFLSATGPTKPFDAKGDGYCRGEGVGMVMLKKLSAALEDGDTILGVVAATAVNQNINSTPITVPHSESQVRLYRKVVSNAGLRPHDIGVVEAHGTGTPVGDPLEMESIRRVFGGASRRGMLRVSSVKGNIGHLEGASGVAGLIKVLLMMRNGTIPAQANFSQLNPKIAPLEPDRLAVPTRTAAWEAAFKAACINNYGAAGSNAAMVVTEPPRGANQIGRRALSPSPCRPRAPRYPVVVRSNTREGVQQRCAQLARLATAGDAADVAFSISTRQNSRLPYVASFAAADGTELQRGLMDAARGGEAVAQAERVRPVVLVFGGQSSSSVGLAREAYDGCALLRHHLDAVDRAVRALNWAGIYPGIFQTEPVADVVDLHCMLFAVQYAGARAWMDSGAAPAALVGHSFGQLTALVVGGSLSLEDGLRLVAGRAALMAELWGDERGAMLAVRAGRGESEAMAARAKAEIACFNGPQSHVLVGPRADINALRAELDAEGERVRPLSTTHGFHSRLADPLIPRLRALADRLRFTNPPRIPIEPCSEQPWPAVTPAAVAAHTREPVFFGAAVRRLEQRLGPCTWLEAGSASAGSSIVSMVRAAVNDPPLHLFQPVQIQPAALADAAVSLARGGHAVSFWHYHALQRPQYAAVALPPHPFERSRHWLEWKPPAPPVAAAPAPPLVLDGPRQLLVGPSPANEFHIDPVSEEYRFYVGGHAVLSQPLLPAPLYIELACRAVRAVSADEFAAPEVQDLRIRAPLGAAANQTITMRLRRAGERWAFEVQSTADGESSPVSHASGTVVPVSNPNAADAERARFEQLVGPDRCVQIAASPEAESLQGALVYKVFSKVVTYAPHYKAVRKVVGRGGEAVGFVHLPRVAERSAESVTRPLAVDNFIQVAGLHVNCLEELGENQVYVCTSVSRAHFAPAYLAARGTAAHSWTVYTNRRALDDNTLTNDIFVFDSHDGRLVCFVLGVVFNKVLISSLGKVLARANTGSGRVAPKKENPPTALARAPAPAPPHVVTTPRNAPDDAIKEIAKGVCALLSQLADVPLERLSLETAFAEVGIDSLMANEVHGEVVKAFDVDIPMDEFQMLTTVGALCQKLHQGDCCSEDACDSDASSDRDEGLGTSILATPGDERGDPVGNVARLAEVVAEHVGIAAAAVDTDALLIDLGLDSLLGMELASDIEKVFGVKVDMTKLIEQSTFGDLATLVFGKSATVSPQDSGVSGMQRQSGEFVPVAAQLSGAQEAFDKIRWNYESYAKVAGFAGFWKNVYPLQRRLVLAYTCEAFAKLGSPLGSVIAGEPLPKVTFLPKHNLQMAQLYAILEDGGLVVANNGFSPCGSDYVRAQLPVDKTPSSILFDQVVAQFPQHSSEHKLLRITGSELAGCLDGSADPLRLLFGVKENRELLEHVYTHAPMYEAATRLLADFLSRAYTSVAQGQTIHILEIGGGTGGTTKHVVDHLDRQGIEFKYTFTDISASLVAAAMRKFEGRKNMTFRVLDIEKTPPEELYGKYHTVISTNCIHATKDLVDSTTNVLRLLRPDGFLSLVEFTRNIFWFDLVFGLLEGWWLSTDGRPHVLASEAFWDASLHEAGFRHVTWTDGPSDDGQTLRILTAFSAPAEKEAFVPQSKKLQRPDVRIETVLYKQVASTPLLADIYYPARSSSPSFPRPIALMIHGGGHILLSRKEVRLGQVQQLLERGLLPVSIDYRLCPETDIINGAMTDVCDALRWARDELPQQVRTNKTISNIQADGSRVVVVGWSTGGTLALTLGFTSIQRDIDPPQAILAFYCPTDYQDEFWRKPNWPEGTSERDVPDYDLLDGVQDDPIASYNIPPRGRATKSGWMNPEDPRSRIVLHMNWRGQALPVLLNGLPSKAKAEPGESYKELPQPADEEVERISPLAQIRKGNWRSPTFLVHGTRDDLIPWEQSVRTAEAVKKKGVAVELEAVEGGVHLFDLYRMKRREANAVERALEWLCRWAF